MPAITIYTTPICPFCHRAKALLDKKGVTYEEIDVFGNAALRAAMIARANGARTVPQIFINDAHIGGCDELMMLNAAGKLDPLLAV